VWLALLSKTNRKEREVRKGLKDFLRVLCGLCGSIIEEGRNRTQWGDYREKK